MQAANIDTIRGIVAITWLGRCGHAVPDSICPDAQQHQAQVIELTAVVQPGIPGGH